MSPLPPLVSLVSTVSGGGAVPVVVPGAMELPMGTPTGPREHPEMEATIRAQAAPMTRTVVSRGRDGHLPPRTTPGTWAASGGPTALPFTRLWPATGNSSGGRATLAVYQETASAPGPAPNHAELSGLERWSGHYGARNSRHGQPRRWRRVGRTEARLPGEQASPVGGVNPE